jgi:hypothetical protein
MTSQPRRIRPTLQKRFLLALLYMGLGASYCAVFSAWEINLALKGFAVLAPVQVGTLLYLLLLRRKSGG